LATEYINCLHWGAQEDGKGLSFLYVVETMNLLWTYGISHPDLLKYRQIENVIRIWQRGKRFCHTRQSKINEVKILWIRLKYWSWTMRRGCGSWWRTSFRLKGIRCWKPGTARRRWICFSSRRTSHWFFWMWWCRRWMAGRLWRRSASIRRCRSSCWRREARRATSCRALI